MSGAYEIPGVVLGTLQASADLSAQHLNFVKMTGATVAAVAATTDPALGVLQNKPSVVGAACSIMVSGVTMARAGAAIAAGAECTLLATGKVGTGGTHFVGIALTAATGDLDIFALLLKPLGCVA